MVARNGPTIRKLSDHSVEVNLAAAQYHEHITCVILRIGESKPNHRRLPVLPFQGFKLKSISVCYVSLRVICYALLIRHWKSFFVLVILWRNLRMVMGRLVGLEPTTS